MSEKIEQRQKNPLSIWLGTFLMEKRVRANSMSAEDFGKLLGGLSKPFVHMIESANSNIPPARAFSLRSALNQLGVTAQLSSITLILSTIQFLDLNDSNENSIENKLVQVAECGEPMLSKLISFITNDSMLKLINEKNDITLKEIFSSEKYQMVIHKFIEGSLEISKKDEHAKQWSDYYENAPSVFNWMLEEQLESLKKLTDEITGVSQFYNLDTWERNNKKYFKRNYGVVRSLSYIIDYMDAFDWDYILNDAFEKYDIIVLKDNALKQNAKKLYSKLVKKFSNELFKNKVKIHFIPEDVFFQNSNFRDFKEYGEFWLYELRKEKNKTITDSIIGFKCQTKFVEKVKEINNDFALIHIDLYESISNKDSMELIASISKQIDNNE